MHRYNVVFDDIISYPPKTHHRKIRHAGHPGNMWPAGGYLQATSTGLSDSSCSSLIFKGKR
ncbi:hypothetical protein HMPREF1548_03456 [Clostridium sp. KLE 1755]|nr:hypothetical protein HMPREF1548_03456 [Clostridium sp. KLE 1755]